MKKAIGTFASAVLGLASCGAAAQCESALDCSLNGDCIAGKCECEPAWSGSPSCDVLAVLPTDKVNGGYHNSTAASWGGNVIYQDGKYHLFVAQMGKHCGLEKYGTNSEIVRAEASSPAGPFHFRETVQPAFAHNPTIRRLPNGEGFVIYFIGGNPTQEVVCGQSTIQSILREGNREKSPQMPSRMTTLVSGSISVIYSESIYGPWSSPVAVEVDDSNSTEWGTGQGSCNGSGMSNPSPHIAADGSVTLALQRVVKSMPGKELLGVARATSWRGPYKMITSSPVAPEEWYCKAGTGEDLFLWRSSRGWHMIFHGMCPTGVMQAYYAFSEDAAKWKVSPRQAYSYHVQYSDGSKHLFARVERPQLFFGSANSSANFEGTPTHLYNGVCSGGNLWKLYQCLELPQKGPVMTYTLARPLKTTQNDDIIFA